MEQKIELAIKLLNKYFQDKILSKPTLFHSVKVWFYLYDNHYSEEIVIGWFLHDILEDTEVTEGEIVSIFWTEVLNLVKANTKNRDLSKETVNEELIKRCADYSQDAIIIKSADILCNYDYYKRTNNQSEIDRCFKLSALVMKYKNSNYEDLILLELAKLL